MGIKNKPIRLFFRCNNIQGIVYIANRVKVNIIKQNLTHKKHLQETDLYIDSNYKGNDLVLVLF